MVRNNYMYLFKLLRALRLSKLEQFWIIFNRLSLGDQSATYDIKQIFLHTVL